MTDVIAKLREAFSVGDDCDFDTLKRQPELRQYGEWEQIAAASDAAAEIERLRGCVDRLVTLIRSIHGHLNDDRINAALAGAADPTTVCPTCKGSGAWIDGEGQARRCRDCPTPPQRDAK